MGGLAQSGPGYTAFAVPETPHDCTLGRSEWRDPAARAHSTRYQSRGRSDWPAPVDGGDGSGFAEKARAGSGS